jgi:hypothetical protein
MAKVRTQRKEVKKVTRKRRSRRKAVPLGEVESRMEEMALSDFVKTTKDELKKLGEKIHEATDKGVHVVKEIAEEVHHYAKDKTELTRLRIELHNMKEERDNLYSLIGQQLRNMYKSNRLSYVKKKFKTEFDRLDELDREIGEHEKHAGELG